MLRGVFSLADPEMNRSFRNFRLQRPSQGAERPPCALQGLETSISGLLIETVQETGLVIGKFRSVFHGPILQTFRLVVQST